jgi:hypothetical protein
MTGADGGGAVPYNYPHFDEYVVAGGDQTDEAAFWAAPRAGEQAADVTLSRLDDGAQSQLSGLWLDRPLVIEFGSFT